MQSGYAIWSLATSMKLLLLISLTGLISCKCESTSCQGTSSNISSASKSSTAGKSSTAVGNSSAAGNNSSSASGGGGDANAFYLNCADLDPDKVYLVGNLSKVVGGYNALVDPEDPTKFCIGFSADTTSHRITTSGELVYIDFSEGPINSGGTVMKFVQDSLWQNDIGWWVYPEPAAANDMQMFDTAELQLFVRRDPATGLDDIYHPVSPLLGELNIYLNANETPYYSLKSKTLSTLRLIGVSPAATLLVGDSEAGIILVDANKQETVVTPPLAGPYNFFWYGVSKFFVDTVTGHQSAWVLVGYQASAEYKYARWTLDLETLEIKDDGPYALVPGTGNEINSKINSKGELIHVVSEKVSEDNYNYFVAKAPLVSTNVPASIIYNDASDLDTTIWQKRPVPRVYVKSGELVTGQ